MRRGRGGGGGQPSARRPALPCLRSEVRGHPTACGVGGADRQRWSAAMAAVDSLPRPVGGASQVGSKCKGQPPCNERSIHTYITTCRYVRPSVRPSVSLPPSLLPSSSLSLPLPLLPLSLPPSLPPIHLTPGSISAAAILCKCSANRHTSLVPSAPSTSSSPPSVPMATVLREAWQSPRAGNSTAKSALKLDSIDSGMSTEKNPPT